MIKNNRAQKILLLCMVGVLMMASYFLGLYQNADKVYLSGEFGAASADGNLEKRTAAAFEETAENRAEQTPEDTQRRREEAVRINAFTEKPEPAAPATNDNTGETGEKTTDAKTGTADTADAEKPVNINTASKAELQTLPGIGEVTAGKIIEYRERNGKFQTIEEIMAVKGIGEKKFAKIKERIVC